MKKILLVGSGNVATHLAKNIDNKNYCINQVFSRSKENAKKLIEFLGCNWTNNPKKILKSDITIISVNDDSIKSVIKFLPNIPTVHTSGCTGIDILKKFNDYGVLYPLQTFRKNVDMNIKEVPFLIETNSKKFESDLFQLASNLSEIVRVTDSKTRKKIHLAAVFACNFTNHMLVLAKKICDESNNDFSLLLPLIKKTFNQINENPIKLQTGPAFREDLGVIEEHLKIIEDKNLKKIYNFLSQNIIHTKNENI